MINDNNISINDKKSKSKRTEAQLNAIHKYDKMHYKSITSKIKIDEFAQINEYASKNNLTVSKMIYKCIQYCMEHDIQLNDML